MKKENLHLFKGTEKIPMGSMFLSLLLSFLRLTLIQERPVDIIRAHRFLLLKKNDILHPRLKQEINSDQCKFISMHLSFISGSGEHN